MCAPRPIATGPGHSHARCGAWPVGHDVTCPETAPNGGRVVAAISEHTVRPLPRSPAFAVQRGNCIQQRQGFLQVVTVRAGQANRERHAPPVVDQMTLAPALGPIGRIWTGLVPPYTARMEQLSTTARDQSIWPSRASQSSSAKWIRSHTPASCQSRSRREHVIPDPHPSSCESICQGMRLRGTKTMPERHARSETRGLPPFGRRGGIGKNGSTRSHNGSGSSAAAIPLHNTSPKRIRFRQFCYTLFRTIKGSPASSEARAIEATSSAIAATAPATDR